MTIWQRCPVSYLQEQGYKDAAGALTGECSAESAIMEPTSAVRTDTLPAIATVVAPGACASASYSWLLLSSAPDLRVFLDQHEPIAAGVAVLLWIVLGFAVESAGSYVEVYLIDRRSPDHPQMLENWWRYLRIAWIREPIGQRYLRRLLVSFKFELNMFVATIASLPGVFFLAYAGRISWKSGATAFVALAMAAALLFFAARGSAQVLADLRARLLTGVGEPPFDPNGNPTRTNSG